MAFEPCPKCGRAKAAGAKLCGECAKKAEPVVLEATATTLIQCPDCGKQASARASSCPHCGAPIASRTTSAVVQPLKNPGIAAVLSFFWSGLGQIYTGRFGAGLFLMIFQMVNAALILVGIGLILFPLTWLVGIIDAYREAERMNRKAAGLAVIALVLLAAPAFAGYEAGFGYQAVPSYSSPRYGYRSGYHGHHHSYRHLPRREVTTITRDGNRTRIETRRYYNRGGTARMKTSSGAWSARSR